MCDRSITALWRRSGRPAPQCRASGIGVTVNGSPVDFDGMGPVEVNGRVLVPVRGVLESLGADVGWNADSQTVVANNGRVDIELRIGDHSASVDGAAVPLDVPAQVIAAIPWCLCASWGRLWAPSPLERAGTPRRDRDHRKD